MAPSSLIIDGKIHIQWMIRRLPCCAPYSVFLFVYFLKGGMKVLQNKFLREKARKRRREKEKERERKGERERERERERDIEREP